MIWVVIVVLLAPGYFIVLASLQPGSSFFSGTLLPRNLTLDNYRRLFSDTEFPTWVKNSMIICTAVSLISTTCVGADGVRLRPAPLLRPPVRPLRPAADPDVPDRDCDSGVLLLPPAI